MSGSLRLGVALLVVSACGGRSAPTGAEHRDPVRLITPETGPSPLQQRLAATAPAKPVTGARAQRRLEKAIEDFHAANPVRRGYIAVDKPLYRAGETIWFRGFELTAATLEPDRQQMYLAQLISPKGAAVIEKGIAQTATPNNDFVLPAGIPGGEYTLRITTPQREVTERKVIISSYQPPRIKKKLEFLRKAYGPGDRVAASLELSRATGEALANIEATGVVSLDGAELARVPVKTDGDGNAVVRFDLPGTIARGDGLLTVLVADGGVTESIQKRVPITLDKISLSLFPEGGDLVAGLPGRVYFMAKNPLDKPADIEGRVVDDRGELAALFRSHWDGMGRFELRPEPGREYFVEITRPAGISGRFAVPAARRRGCAMMAVDGDRARDVRVAVWCTGAKTVTASAVLRGDLLATRTVEVAGGAAPTVIALPAPESAGQGAVRVTLFDGDLDPIAERLIYRQRGADLDVAITADQTSYNPRDPVQLSIETTIDDRPVAADLALAVVDDTVLSFADDKTATLLAEVYVESEMPGQKIEDPNFLFGDDARAPAALDMVLGTKGWRRFDWKQVFPEPPPITDPWEFTGVFFKGKRGRVVRAPSPPDRDADGVLDDDDKLVREADNKKKNEMVARRLPGKLKDQPEPKIAEQQPRVAANQRAPRPEPVAPAAVPPPVDMGGEAMEIEEADEDCCFGGDIVIARQRGQLRHRFRFGDDVGGGQRRRIEIIDRDWNDGRPMGGWGVAPVRVFPVPSYPQGYEGPRNDFRETVFWQASVKTDDQGRATVRFPLSDSVTSFRAIAEGAGGGRLGRGEAEIQSKLPVSLAVKMPLEVSRGDRISLPVTVANETDERRTARLTADFGAAFKRRGPALPAELDLAPGQRRSFFYDLEVVGDGADPAHGKARIVARAAGLQDRVERTIKVLPVGFPIEVSASGTLAGHGRRIAHRVPITDVVGDRMSARLTLYPTALSTMTEGLEAVIREPTGCFEQASSANYPNVMVLAYTEESDAKIAPELVEKTHDMLDRGYQKLTGYESPSRGYEWFGGDPGHEALTAYGLMEFVDMAKVYGDVDDVMIGRTARWLKSRRDGKGGYKQNARALDSFGRASPEVTNAYITYALTEAKVKGIGGEIARQKTVAQTTRDPYVMALATNTLLNTDPKSGAARAAAARLLTMQDKAGAFTGADHSITRSGGVALDIETTSLAALALVRAGDRYRDPVRRAVDWLNKNRDGFGGYGSTQSTVLALKAMSAYAKASKRTRASGVVSVWVNGELASEVSYEKGRQGAIEIDLSRALRPGDNKVEIGLDSSASIPYSLLVEWRSKVPATSPDAKVALETRLDKRRVPMGEGATLGVTLRNKTNEGIPMTLARVGIPGGMTFQTWQLKELVDKKLIDFYETREREVVLYLRSMAPRAVKRINLELLARVPGTYVAPASRGYLYYTDEHKVWVDPLSIEVTR